MTIQPTLLPFPIFIGNYVNIVDELAIPFPGPPPVTRSQGQQIVIDVPVEDLTGRSPYAPQAGNIIGFAAYACLGLGAVQPMFGRLGKLVAGLSAYGGPRQAGPFTQLPADATLLATLYDGSQDVTPPNPTQIVPAALLQLSAVVSFPIPLPMRPGLTAGLWLTPSLIGYYPGRSGELLNPFYVAAASLTLYTEAPNG